MDALDRMAVMMVNAAPTAEQREYALRKFAAAKFGVPDGAETADQITHVRALCDGRTTR